MSEINVQPRFDISSGAERYTDSEHGIQIGDAVLCLRALEQGINAAPLDYLVYLQDWLARDMSSDSEEQRRLLDIYFNARLDRQMEFDPDTEDAIDRDTGQRRALAGLEGAKNYVVHTGVMQTRMKENTASVNRRDSARVSRLSVYVIRVLQWQAQQTETSTPLAV